MDSFYVYLPSNVKDPFNRNTTSNYSTNLSSTLRLDESWEVALSEISFNKTWYNIDENFFVGIINLDEETYIKTETNPGNYDIRGLINEINKKILELDPLNSKEDSNLPKFVYNEDDKKTLIKISTESKLFPLVSSNLMEILGFNELANVYDDFFDDRMELCAKYLKDLHEEYISEKSPHLSQGNDTLFVYCNIVQQSFVGDTQAQILRIIKVPEANYDKPLNFIYDRPNYFPLVSNEINSIEINIKDDADENVRFNDGKLYVVLHFRKRKQTL
ncbi:MAG: hypothetical protein QM535_22595 [Limnohabitans sp.]|nr:hypothetical protein [Limnohabitans sp.]